MPRDLERKRIYDREYRRNLTDEQREKERRREQQRQQERQDRERRCSLPVFMIMKHCSSWIMHLAMAYYIVTVITMPIAWVMNAYAKTIAVRTVRALRCGGAASHLHGTAPRPRRLVLNFRCGSSSKYPYHGAVAAVHGTTKKEIDAAMNYSTFVDDKTRKRFRQLVLNMRGLNVFLCHHTREDGAVVVNVCASKYPANHRQGKWEARRTFLNNGIRSDKVTIIPIAHRIFGFHGEHLEESLQRALYKEPGAEPSEKEDYSSDEEVVDDEE